MEMLTISLRLLTPAACTVTTSRTRLKKYEKEGTFFMASQKIRITLKAYDHKLIDQTAAQIVEIGRAHV